MEVSFSGEEILKGGVMLNLKIVELTFLSFFPFDFIFHFILFLSLKLGLV